MTESNRIEYKREISDGLERGGRSKIQPLPSPRTRRRDALGRKIKVATVPYLLKEKVTLKTLKKLVSTQQSKFRSGPLEGVMVRQEDDNWLQARGKLVRAEFTQAIDSHWRSRRIEWNRLSFDDQSCAGWAPGDK